MPRISLSGFLLAAAILVAAFLVEAQQESDAHNRYRVVVLSSGQSAQPDHPLIVGLRAGLRSAGYQEGHDLFLAVPRHKNYRELLATIKRYRYSNINVFVTIGATDTALAKQAGLNKPIIFMPTRDPVGRGLVKSLARPETNLTGIAYETDIEMVGKGLEYFRRLVPGLARVLVLYEERKNNPAVPRSLPVLRNVSKRLGLELVESAVSSYDQSEKAVLGLRNQKILINGIFVVCTNFFTGDPSSPAIAKEQQLPFYGCPSQVRKFGALVSYAPDFFYIGQRGAWYVDQILKGATPQTLPVETPKEYELIVNLKTAEAIGLNIPPEALQLANKVIRHEPQAALP